MVGADAQKWKTSSLLVMILAFCLLIGHIALAGEAMHQGGDRSGDLRDLLYRFINFALLVSILFWAIKKSGVKDFFAVRVEEIRLRLDGLRKEKEKTEQKYRDAERRLREFEARKREILDQFRQEGVAEKEKIIREARKRASQIVEQAESNIRQEVQATRDRLRQEVINLAARKAEEIISQGMTDKDQDHLVNEFIEKVEKIH
jgi:F-type H+-transporting ATPase subunit b